MQQHENDFAGNKTKSNFARFEKMIRQLVTYIFLLFSVASLHAQNARFEMSAPNAVETGQQFRLTFTTHNERGNSLPAYPIILRY